MADNIAITAGAGTDVATDDCGAGGHTQIVKLAIATNGSATLIPADATDGILVNLGANNDVTITSGNITLTGTNNIATVTTVTTVSTVTNLSQLGGAAIAMGTGVRSAGTQRVTIATDDVVPVTGTFWQATQPVSLASVPSHAVTNAGTFAVQAVCTNAGTFAVQVDGSALTSLQLIDDIVFTDDAAFTPGTSKVSMVGFQADETATDSVDEGDAGAARMTLDRKMIVTTQPHTKGGLSISRDIDLDNSTLTVVKASAGQLYGWDITNTGTVTVFVKFYDAASGTLGTGTPVMTIAIPGNSSDDTLSSKLFANGVEFATGICVGAGTGVADADNTDPGANAVVANIYYK